MGAWSRTGVKMPLGTIGEVGLTAGTISPKALVGGDDKTIYENRTDCFRLGVRTPKYKCRTAFESLDEQAEVNNALKRLRFVTLYFGATRAHGNLDFRGQTEASN